MAVLKRYVPEPTSIKDYRDRGGVFYEAKCEQCSRIFYPKRGTAKYCSKQCGIEYRNGGKLEKKDEKSTEKRQSSDYKYSLDVKPSPKKVKGEALAKLKERIQNSRRVHKGK